MKPQQASNTAKVIAGSTILLARDPRDIALVPPDAAALCQRYLSGTFADRCLAKSATLPLTRLLWRRLEQLTLPGIMAHYWHRKRWIESRCRSAIAEGFNRLIVLGAGLDTLAHRLAEECSQLQAIEVDHPATQNAKRLALAIGDSPQPDRLSYVPLDFTHNPFPTSLLDDTQDTVVVIEGVLMYLTPTDVDRIFSTLHALSASRVRVIFSFMTKWPDGRSGFRPHSWLIERWLAWRKEPFVWAIEPERIPSFLAAHRFKLLELATTRDFAERSTIAASALEGENLVLCEPA